MSARRLPILTALLALWVLVSPALAAACCYARGCEALAGLIDPSSSAEPADAAAPADAADHSGDAATAHCGAAADAQAAAADSTTDPADAAIASLVLSSTACERAPAWNLDLRALTPSWHTASIDAPEPTAAAPEAAVLPTLSHRLPTLDARSAAPPGAVPALFTLHGALLI